MQSSTRKYKAIEAIHFFITLLSNASVNCYSDNTFTIITVDLDRPVVLSANERWEAGLCEFSCVTVPNFEAVHNNYAFIYCEIISPQLVGSDSVRCLRCIT
jgi:hypothetical protein